MNRSAILFALFASAWHGPALAQAPAWPQKPVRVLVGLAPEATRIRSRACSRRSGAKPSASSSSSRTVRCGQHGRRRHHRQGAPDGYTFSSATAASSLRAHLYNPCPTIRFAIFRRVPRRGGADVAGSAPSVPAGSLAELIALAKSAKEPMPYASSETARSITSRWNCSSRYRREFHARTFQGAGQSVRR